MKRWCRTGWALLAFSSVIRGAGAVENCSIEGKSFDGKPYRIALSPVWTDEGVLHALGLDIHKAKLTTSAGPDGEERAYVSGRKRVSIVRSVSTGIMVLLSLKDGDTYVWHLSDCRANTPERKEIKG
jgi:hypothetical protein